jgi:hypothetical protein
MPRSALSAYLWLAAAPFGSAWELFLGVALIFSMCLFVAGLRQQRRQEKELSP